MAQVSYIKRDINQRAIKPPRRSNGGSLLVTLMFAYAVLPAAAQNLLNVRAPVWANIQTETSPLASAVGQALQFAVIGVVALLALNGLSRFRGGWWFVVFLLPWVTMTIATVYMEHRFSYTSLIYPLVGVVAGSLKDPLATLRTVGVLTSMLAAGSIAMGVLMPASGLFSISTTNDKSIIGSALLAGPLYHPNSLGETLAIGLPFVSLIRTKGMRRISYLLVLFALVWTGSRTGMIAAGLGIVVASAWCLIRKYQKRSMFSPLVLLAIYSSVVFVGPAILAYGAEDVSSFSGRGQIWLGTLEYWAKSPLIGHGVHIYADLAKMWNNVGFGAFHGHNMYATFLITSGILGAAALTIVYFSILVRSWKLGRAAIIGPAVWAISFIADGWLEVPSDLFTLGTISWVVWIPLAVVLSGSLTRIPSEPDSPNGATTPEPARAAARPGHSRNW